MLLPCSLISTTWSTALAFFVGLDCKFDFLGSISTHQRMCWCLVLVPSGDARKIDRTSRRSMSDDMTSKADFVRRINMNGCEQGGNLL